MESSDLMLAQEMVLNEGSAIVSLEDRFIAVGGMIAGRVVIHVHDLETGEVERYVSFAIS